MHRKHVWTAARNIQLQRTNALRSIEKKQNAAPAQQRNNLLKWRAESGRVINRADRNQARIRSERCRQLTPIRLDELHAFIGEQRRIVEVIRKLARESHHAVAWFPIEPAYQ